MARNSQNYGCFSYLCITIFNNYTNLTLMFSQLLKALVVTPALLTAAHALADAPAGYSLVWSDEFNEGTQLSADKWQWEDWRAGNVNNELQTYKPGTQTIDGRHTTEIKNGNLVINCFKGSDGLIYSGRVNALSGNDVNGWRYGYMEARIKLPKGKGTWPAFWMMPSGVDWWSETWPTCGEIDIMEEVGVDANITSSSLHAIGHNHTNNTQITASRLIEGAEDDFHIYAIEWTNDRITTYVDGEVMLDYANDHKGFRNWPYDKPYYIILNLAWGGDWGGYQGVDANALPIEMLVDYVRVYQKPLPSMKADGSDAAYIFGSYRSVGIDGYVPSDSYYAWDQNVLPMTSNGKIHTFEFIAGQNLRADDVNFKFFASPVLDDAYGFLASAGKYHVTMEENPYLYIDTEEDGNVKLKDGVTLNNRDRLLVTLDCTAGTDKAVAKVTFTEGQPIPAPKGIWIIGGINSVGAESYIDGDWGWSESRAIPMQKDGDVYTHTFEVGKTLNPSVVNFKFFGDSSFSNEFCAVNSDYLISSESDIFGIGDGNDGHDNGNVYLLNGATLKDGDVVNVKVDCTDGYDRAVLTTTGTYTASISTIEAILPAEQIIYNLQGMRISRITEPGIYIINGKKMLVK
nr:family 16 glycosylhydrolase [Bacteroides sp.]